MALTLHRLLRRLKISSNRSISSQSYTSESRSSDVIKIPAARFVQKEKTDFSPKIFTALNFTPRSLNLDQTNHPNNAADIYSKIIKCPVLTNLEIIEPPKSISVDNVEDYFPATSSMELPSPSERVVEKQAARLIVIRKKKMKKHKLRKLRKKMKFEWAKVRQRREMRKEKAFRAELLAQIHTAEKFDAVDYVASKINEATEIQIPRFWKGRRLPQFIIRQKLGLDKVEKN